MALGPAGQVVIVIQANQRKSVPSRVITRKKRIECALIAF